VAALGGERRRALCYAIHVDHAGRAGAWCGAGRTCRSDVHERAAALADPSRHGASAARCTGATTACRRIWGEVVPVREANCA